MATSVATEAAGGWRLMSVKEVAGILGIPRQQVYELAHEGILPAVWLGKRMFVRSDVLDAWTRQGGKRYAGGWRRVEGDGDA